MPSQGDSEGRRLIREAMIAVRGVSSTAAEDPMRPGFHFRPPARWLNDPNGPTFLNGWHHVFYQHNPYGDGWENMHWGHARSRNLVDWEHLPIALWPSKAAGEDHVFSGSTFVRADGKPVIFYTSIGRRAPEQWMAVPLDDDLIAWEKHGPVVTSVTHAPLKIDEWRDPYLFTLNGQTIMICGGRHEGKGAVSAYRALDDSLTKWLSLGIIFHHPTLDLIECPNLVQIDSKWVLLTSMHGRIEAFVGELDAATMRFKSERSLQVAAGSYASQLYRDERGRNIFLSWINVGGAVGWTGCFALPSILDLDEEAHVTLEPLPGITDLRRKQLVMDGHVWTGELKLDPKMTGRQIELGFNLELEDSTVVEIMFGSGGDGAPGHRLLLNGAKRTLTTPRGEFPVRDFRMHMFWDQIVLDVYADGGRLSQSMGLPRGVEGGGLRITATGGNAQVNSLWACELRSAEFKSYPRN